MPKLTHRPPFVPSERVYPGAGPFRAEALSVDLVDQFPHSPHLVISLLLHGGIPGREAEALFTLTADVADGLATELRRAVRALRAHGEDNTLSDDIDDA